MPQLIVKPTIAERFINEVPRFFGGWRPTLREIFQNAYRAGATEVTVTLDATQMILTIADNGRGCPDVEALMCIGRSDWDETQVVEAAGLGFISALNGALLDRVTARSANWRAEWKCQAKELASAKVYEADPVKGFTVSLCLKDRHDDVAGDIQQARAYYPFKVTFNGESVEAVPVKHDLVLDTPVGRVYWERGTYAAPSSYRAVWEWRDLKSGAFADALNEAFHRQLPYHLRTVYDHYPRFTWFVDPACGVTPKLPDRNDLQDDVHLKAAVQIIAQAFCDHALALVKAYADKLPDTVATVKDLNSYITAEDVRGIMRELLNWSQVKADDFAGLSVTWEQCADGPGTYPQLDHSTCGYDVLSRTEHALGIRQADVTTVANWLLLKERTLCLRTVADAEAKKDPSAAIKIVGQKHKPGSRVATAARIIWNGEDLPFYLNPAASLTGESSEPLIVLTGSAPQMMQTYDEYAELFRGWLLSVADNDGYLSDWCEEEYDEWSADTDRIDDALQTDILRYGSRRLQQAQQREVSARSVLRGLHAARRALADIGEGKVDQSVDGLLPDVKKRVEAAIKKYAAEQQRLAAIIEA